MTRLHALLASKRSAGASRHVHSERCVSFHAPGPIGGAAIPRRAPRCTLSLPPRAKRWVAHPARPRACRAAEQAESSTPGGRQRSRARVCAESGPANRPEAFAASWYQGAGARRFTTVHPRADAAPSDASWPARALVAARDAAAAAASFRREQSHTSSESCSAPPRVGRGARRRARQVQLDGAGRILPFFQCSAPRGERPSAPEAPHSAHVPALLAPET